MKNKKEKEVVISEVPSKKGNMEKIVMLSAIALMLTTGINIAFADSFDFEARRAEVEQKISKMQDVFATGSYDDWVILSDANLEERINRMREQHQEMSSQVTPENWARFAEAHQLMAAGDIAGARVIMDELGIEMGVNKGFGMRNGKGMGHFDKSDRGIGFGQGGRNSEL